MPHYLIPDDEGLLPLMRRTSEYLIEQLCDRPSGEDDFALPELFRSEAPVDAYCRILAAIVRGLETVDEHQLYKPDGHYQHVPLAVVDLDADDVAQLRAVDAVIREAETAAYPKARELADLDELIDQLGHAFEHALEPAECEDRGKALAARLHRIVDLLAASGDEQEAAYQYLAARYTLLLHPESPRLHRYVY